VISVFGIGPAFLFIACCYLVSFALLVGLPLTTRHLPTGGSGRSVAEDLRQGFAYVRRHRTLISILGVTVIVNAFYFTYTPMIPVFAERLDVNAFWTGILASANAIGMMVGTLFVAKGLAIKRGQIYVFGSVLSFVFLFVFAAVDYYPIAFLALICAGVGVAGFSTMQSALVLTTADDDMRGRAMGMLSMGIGALPFAMLVLGGVAQAVGPSAAVMGSVAVGLLAMGLWGLWRPEVQRIG
jgi:predicted MFS family arabinose efflux permease